MEEQAPSLQKFSETILLFSLKITVLIVDWVGIWVVLDAAFLKFNTPNLGCSHFRWLIFTIWEMCQLVLVSQNACFCFGSLLTASEWLKFGATDGLFSWCVTESGVVVALSCLDIGICLDCSQGHTGQVSQVGTNEHSLTRNSEIPAEQLGRQEAPFRALTRFSTQNFLLCLLGQSVLPVCPWQ